MQQIPSEQSRRGSEHRLRQSEDARGCGAKTGWQLSKENEPVHSRHRAGGRGQAGSVMMAHSHQRTAVVR